MTTIYQCPKCGGSNFFMSKKTVIKGVGGIWGNRGGLKEFPVCRVCDEIMFKSEIYEAPSEKFIKLLTFGALALIIAVFTICFYIFYLK